MSDTIEKKLREFDKKITEEQKDYVCRECGRTTKQLDKERHETGELRFWYKKNLCNLCSPVTLTFHCSIPRTKSPHPEWRKNINAAFAEFFAEKDYEMGMDVKRVYIIGENDDPDLQPAPTIGSKENPFTASNEITIYYE